ncbi:MAG TPA: RDD family protein [Candidatus Acidoferrales bacterium]|nr:RDD family protein [Candidatus Acidoferrales bacterium]
MTKTCSQCGAILPSSVRACTFCDSSLSESPSLNANPAAAVRASREAGGADDLWRGELEQRVASYRARRKKGSANEQPQLPFEAPGSEQPIPLVALAEPTPPAPAIPEEEFSFTIAIGRTANSRERDPRVFIDVSEEIAGPESSVPTTADAITPGLYPVASIEDRRLAGLADGACLLFAYGAFLALFGSLGGQLTLSKLSAAVCATTFAIVYLQYFALFTIFGGTTPGMMLRGLHVVSFDGEPPTPSQMGWRSAGYVVSAATCFLGFLWSMWDEDELTWHDRLSRTYLSHAETFAEVEPSAATHAR